MIKLIFLYFDLHEIERVRVIWGQIKFIACMFVLFLRLLTSRFFPFSFLLV